MDASVETTMPRKPKPKPKKDYHKDRWGLQLPQRTGAVVKILAAIQDCSYTKIIRDLTRKFCKENFVWPISNDVLDQIAALSIKDKEAEREEIRKILVKNKLLDDEDSSSS